jgi:hypothetical protein
MNVADDPDSFFIKIAALRTNGGGGLAQIMVRSAILTFRREQ